MKQAILSVLLLILFCIPACQNKKQKPDFESLGIELMQGDLVLCSGEQFGEVRFALSCDYSIREAFDLALSLLHSFEYEEAEKAFVKVIDADPACAMAYWGVAMSNFHPLWAPPNAADLENGAKLLKVAESLPQTPREKDYLDAIRVFYTDWEKLDHKTRAKRFEQKMEALYKKYPDDTEAAIFYALALNATADPMDKTFANQRKAGRLLESLFPNQPNHPGLAHYLIHNYDYPELAELALPSARRYAKIAPASAHAQHMPSHIFTRLGLWQESINSNLNSASSALCYSESLGKEAHWAQEIHAMDYLVYAYLQTGNNEKARAEQTRLQSFKAVFPLDFAVAYAAAAIPARIALENRQWTDAAQLQVPAFAFPWEQFPWQKSIVHFTRALGASHTGDIGSAENELRQVQALHAELLRQENTYQANQVLIQIKAAEAWINQAKGNAPKAIALMTEAADLEARTAKHPVTPGEVLPAMELLGDLYLAQGKPSDALGAYETALKSHQNRFNAIYGAALAARGKGDREKAGVYFERLLKLTDATGGSRPEIQEAKSFLKQTL